MFPRALVVLGPLQKSALAKLIVFSFGIANEISKGPRSELLALLPFKHVALKLYFSLFGFVLGTSFGDRSPIFVIVKVIPPGLTSFPNCQWAPPFRRLQPQRSTGCYMSNERHHNHFPLPRVHSTISSKSNRSRWPTLRYGIRPCDFIT